MILIIIKTVLYSMCLADSTLLGESSGEEDHQKVLEPEVAVQGKCSVSRADHQLSAGGARCQVFPASQVAVHDLG